MAPDDDPWLDRPFAWPDLRAERVIALGIGGGADAVTAWALARWLGPDVAYGNTKTALDDDLPRLSPRLACVPDDVAVRGKTSIERRLPRGPRRSPLVVQCERDADPGDVARELAAVGFDRVLCVDTGGDALDPRPKAARDRDRRMLDVVRALGARALLVVVAPGADGQQSRDGLAAAIAAEVARGAYRGAFSLEPLVPALRSQGAALGPDRTTNIVCRAFDEATDPVVVPRGRKPAVPRRWLTTALVFDV